MSSPTESIRAALDRVRELDEMKRTGTSYAIVQLAEEDLAEWTPRFAKALEIALDNIESVDLRAHAEREIARLLEEETHG